ncbi:hypothetical protein KCTC52924_02346 [Arenibacter antarcticus]
MGNILRLPKIIKKISEQHIYNLEAKYYARTCINDTGLKHVHKVSVSLSPLSLLVLFLTLTSRKT